MIQSFQGRARFLSNFWSAAVVFDSVEHPTVEHAYQAAKTLDLCWRERIRQAPTPGRAKRLSREFALRDDWDVVRVAIMESLVRQKFQRHSHLARALVATGDQELVEGNLWHDQFWGRCHCPRHGGQGQNHLGEILMRVRAELANAQMSISRS